MKAAIEILKNKLDELLTDKANYYKWIAEARKNGNEYGVRSYSESREEVMKLIPEIREAIKVLRSSLK